MNLKLGGQKVGAQGSVFQGQDVDFRFDFKIKSNLKSTLESTVSSSRIKMLRRDWKTTM